MTTDNPAPLLLVFVKAIFLPFAVALCAGVFLHGVRKFPFVRIAAFVPCIAFVLPGRAPSARRSPEDSCPSIADAGSSKRIRKGSICRGK